MSYAKSLLFSFMGIDDVRAEAIRLHRQLAEQSVELEKALAEAQKEALRRDMVIEISESSPWSYEISADDEVTAAQYADRLVEKIHAERSGKPMGWVDLVHPEDRERVLAAFRAAIEDHSGNTSYNETYRVLGGDGGFRWVRSAGRMSRRPDGIGEFFGMATDFTAQFEENKNQQKQLEESLRKAREANAKIAEQAAFTHIFLSPAYRLIISALMSFPARSTSGRQSWPTATRSSPIIWIPFWSISTMRSTRMTGTCSKS